MLARIRHFGGAPRIVGGAGAGLPEPSPPTIQQAVCFMRRVTGIDLGLERNWWDPISIDLALRWIEVERARRCLHHVEAHGVRDVEVTTSRTRLWRSLASATPHMQVRVTTDTRAALREVLGGGRGDLLKVHGMDRRVRRMATVGQRGAGPAPSGRWAGVLEVPTPSMTENVITLAREVQGTIVSCDPRTFKLAASHGLSVINLWAHGPAGNGQPDLRRRMGEALRRVDAVFAEAAGAGLVRLAEQLSTDFGRVRAALAALDVEKVAMSSDQHRYGVLATWAARDLGISSIVLQHGFVSHPLAYLPVRADRVAAIGPRSRDWFIANGTEPTRVTATGSPRFPELSEFATSPPRTLLVPLNSNAASIANDLVLIAARAAATVPGATIVVRPHPGERRVADLSDTELLATLGTPSIPGVAIEVDRSPSVVPTLRRADVVLNWDSSVAYEALCAGVPVLLYSPRELDNPQLDTALPSFADEQQLTNLIGLRWPATVALSRAVRSNVVSAGGSTAVRNILTTFPA